LCFFLVGCASTDPSKDITTIRILSDRISRLEDSIKEYDTKLKQQEEKVMELKVKGGVGETFYTNFVGDEKIQIIS